MIKSNTRLTKTINGDTVQIILTVAGETYADWHARHEKVIKELINNQWEVVE